MDTTTPGGKLVFHIFGSLAEFERALIVERTLAGLAAACARGRKGGRPKGSIRYDQRKLALAQQLYDEQKHMSGYLQDARDSPHAVLPLHLGGQKSGES